MTDIFIRRTKPNKRPLILFSIAVALVVVGLLFFLRRPAAEEEAEAEPMEELASPVEIAPLLDPAEPETKPGTSPDRGLRLLAQARAAHDQNQLLGARTAALQILESSSHRGARRAAENLLSELNIDLVMSPRPMPEKVEYTIQSGDSLARIAKKFDTTIELLQKGNGVSGSRIRAGDRLRILQGRFSIDIDKSDNVLLVRLDDRFFKRYAVGTGKLQKTPTGQFHITERIAQPTWWRPDGKAIPFGDTNNVLGTHWLSLDARGYGIHGTWEPDTIGRQASAGCVRLLNKDIEELFALIPRGTPVQITE